MLAYWYHWRFRVTASNERRVRRKYDVAVEVDLVAEGAGEALEVLDADDPPLPQLLVGDRGVEVGAAEEPTSLERRPRVVLGDVLRLLGVELVDRAEDR